MPKKRKIKNTKKIKKIKDLSTQDFFSYDDYFNLDRNFYSLGQKYYDKSMFKGDITDQNFFKYLSPANKETYETGKNVLDIVYTEYVDFNRGEYENFDHNEQVIHLQKKFNIGNYWTKTQLYRYFLNMAKKFGFPNKFSDSFYDSIRSINPDTGYPFPKWSYINLLPFKRIEKAGKSKKDFTLYQYAKIIRIQKSEIVMLVKLARDYAESKIANFLVNYKDALYSPGRAISSKLSDKFLEDVNSEKIKHLVHCKNITRRDLIDWVNKTVVFLSDDDQIDLMIRLIDELGEKYNIIINDEELDLNDLKHLSKQILVRISKYDLCKFLDDHNFTSELIKILK